MELDVVLACGCLESNAFAFQHLGQSGEYQTCASHPNGKGRFGTQKILRRANAAERILWYDYGIAAAKRGGTDTSAKLRDVRTQHGQKARAKSKPKGEQQALF